MWWKNSLCTSANEDLGTLAEYDPLTCLQMWSCNCGAFRQSWSQIGLVWTESEFVFAAGGADDLVEEFRGGLRVVVIIEFAFIDEEIQVIPVVRLR